MDSPPKRMTRARAATKPSAAPAVKRAHMATAASKAKSTSRTTTAATTPATAATTTSRTSVKRKSPADDDEEHEMQPAKKMTAVETKSVRGRGRPRKVPVESPAPEPVTEPAPAPAPRPRGRPKKNADSASAPAEPPKPVKAARTTKKTTVQETATTEAAPEPVKRPRGRPPLTASSTTSAPIASALAKKPAVKKTVKFEEPEKENVEAAAEAPVKKTTKTTTASGLRGKPVRGGASTTKTRPRTAKTTTHASNGSGKPMPLSPKKVNQLILKCVDSDDELGMDEKSPVRVGPGLKKLPIKAALVGAKAAATATTAKPVMLAPAVGENDENAAVAIIRPEPTTADVSINQQHMLATPAKRVPASPWKGSIASPAKKIEGTLLFGSTPAAALKQADDDLATQAAAPRMSLLQSPAKRQVRTLVPVAEDSTTLQEDHSATTRSSHRMSLLQTPAKRNPRVALAPLPEDNTLATINLSPVKLSFLSSPAKRSVVSPVKMTMPSTVQEEQEESGERSPTPKATLFAISPKVEKVVEEPAVEEQPAEEAVAEEPEELVDEEIALSGEEGPAEAAAAEQEEPAVCKEQHETVEDAEKTTPEPEDSKPLQEEVEEVVDETAEPAVPEPHPEVVDDRVEGAEEIQETPETEEKAEEIEVALKTGDKTEEIETAQDTEEKVEMPESQQMAAEIEEAQETEEMVEVAEETQDAEEKVEATEEETLDAEEKVEVVEEKTPHAEETIEQHEEAEPMEVDDKVEESEKTMEEPEQSLLDAADAGDTTIEADDEESTVPKAVENASTEPATESPSVVTKPESPRKPVNPMFGLRQKDLAPYDLSDSDSEDESPTKPKPFASTFNTLPATPRNAGPRRSSIMPSTGRSTTRRLRSSDKMGFTPLAEQLSGWTAGPSPVRQNTTPASPIAEAAVPDADGLPAMTEAEVDLTAAKLAQNAFFDNDTPAQTEAMDIDEADEDAVTEMGDDDYDPDRTIEEEDLQLVAEADNMSRMEQDDAPVEHDDSTSDASQEYGDENSIPIDPTLLALSAPNTPAQGPHTPRRFVHQQREVHTVSKVPLKPADESTPRPKTASRCYSASRVPGTRSSERIRNRNAAAAALAQSPSTSRGAPAASAEEETAEPEQPAEQKLAPVTPQKTDLWTAVGTPARTPRRDLNPALLKGAVVFVDVHTSEGADASSIFVELLTQMGARCVKQWAWNPNNGESGADTRVGITHVVYKDGGKRTLEKVRQAGGLVQCVGVSWVLDCERENQWLDESPYQIDTSIIPRGGARRRKSMEPRAVAKKNGTRVSSGTSRASQPAPSTPPNNSSSSRSRRRESSLWMWSPGKSPEEEEDDGSGNDPESPSNHKNGSNHDADTDIDSRWATLTPVPKTPATQAVARFVAAITPGSLTPSSVGSDDDSYQAEHDDYEQHEQGLRTCPPPKRTAFMEPGLDSGLRLFPSGSTYQSYSSSGGNGARGSGATSANEQAIMLRLMAARRKSLQFAPKVGSPLSKAWRA
ncbi:hypothetical protein VTJ83DRAFT_372 [Remersonia thermophila]|uniref:BRCT domain-containing protein n=1 Tax=Remersonia thermophila TaxID=72144 RepID=A0ABR4DL61_9PEZI